jgi:hypothetical protein
MAVDGVVALTSYWSGENTPSWLEVDLQEKAVMNRVKVVFFWDGKRYYQYKVDASPDGANWQTVADQSQNMTVSTDKGFVHEFQAVEARYVRVHILKNSANPGAHIVELMVFGAEE